MAYYFERMLSIKEQSKRQIIQRHYNSMAESYDNIESEPFYANQYEVYERHLNRNARFVSGSVLDLGCGTGIQTEWLARYGSQVTGIDISDQLLKMAAEKCASYGTVKLAEADAANLPFPDASFDSVVSYGETISHAVVELGHG
ncbi:MAG: class I SAM-dependent methyltransferase [Blastocatellia bacterium]